MLSRAHQKRGSGILAKQPDQSSPSDARREIGKPREGDDASKRESAKKAAQIRSQIAKAGAEGRVENIYKDLPRLKKNVERPTGLGITSRTTKDHMDFEPTKYSPKGRKLRKDFERPHPDLPPNAVENRNRKPVAFTLPPDLIEDLNERCRVMDVSRTSFVEAAIRRALAPS